MAFDERLAQRAREVLSTQSQVYVAEAGLRTEKALRTWIERGVSFVRGLPPKPSAATARRAPKKAR
jgi:hypothetical protein